MGKEVRITIAAVDRVAAPIRAVNRQIESMLGPIRRVKRDLVTLRGAAGFDRIAKSARALGGPLTRIGKLVGIGGGGLVGAMAVAVKKTADIGDQVAKLSARTGVAVRDIQTLGYAYSRSGGNSEEFGKILDKLTKNLGDARAGTGSLYSILSLVDPQLLHTLQTTDDTGEAFRILVSAIGKLPNEVQKASLAQAAFGEEAKAISNLALEGADGIEKLEKRAEALGFVMSKDAAKASEVFNDSLTDLKLSLTGVIQSVTVGLIPVITDVIQKTTAWIGANRELVTGGVKVFLDQTVDGLKLFWEKLNLVIPPVVKFIQQIGGMKTVLIGVGIVLAASVIAPLVGLAAALATPAGGILALFALIYAQLWALGKLWDKVKVWATSALDVVLKKARELVDLIPKGVVDFFGFGGGGGTQVAAVTPANWRRSRTVADQVASAAGGGQARAQVGGKLRIDVNQSGRVTGASLDSTGDIGLDVYAGPMLSPAY